MTIQQTTTMKHLLFTGRASALPSEVVVGLVDYQ